MLVSMNWLQQYVDLDSYSADELADLITKGGIEVETVEQLNKGISGVVIGHVLSCEQHPDADKLNICRVDIGEEEPVQIICGAANIAAGQYVAVAKVGAVLPGNFKIKKAKLRGEASHGMICSLQELGIESKLVHKEYADGIFVFSDDVTPGEDALHYLNLNDEILELGLTPNRADAMNMIGVAYEVGAVLNRSIELPSPELVRSEENAQDYVSVQIENEDDNPYYGATVIKNVTIASSPQWLINRLVSAGIRPINNVVDITNYVLLEYGQPLHAFDYDRFGSKEVVIRRAAEGEKIVTLDDTERTLSSDHLVITNGSKPVAVAGVMGGADSEVQQNTTTILLEAAYFDSKLVRKASKDLGLRSDSSARFEKGIDRNRVIGASERAAQLIQEIAGGTVLKGTAEQGDRTVEGKEVSIEVTRINQVLGTEISETEVAAIFERLQFSYQNFGGTFTVQVPPRRPDITISEDLIEEVGRLYGYDNVPATLPITESTPGQLSDYQKKRRRVRRALEGAGLYQTVTYSLTSPSKRVFFSNETTDAIRLAMPMSEERSELRTSLLPHLLEVAQYNKNRQLENLAFYETASVFLPEGELPKEQEHLAGVVSGLWQEHLWQKEKKPVDFFVVKGILEELAVEFGVEDRLTFARADEPKLHPGRTAAVHLDDELIGYIGQLHPEVEKELDLSETYVFEINLEALLKADVDHLKYKKLPRFPSVTRDVALVVNESLEAGQVKRVIEEAGGAKLVEINLFDVYQGEHLEEGKKSLAFSLRYYNPEQTLTEEEVKKAHDRVLTAVEEQFGAALRS
ncbi:phenylalanine--tRNA ligase subunit beta [Guptibacillus hwajinpoensis]|uniref:Phenylalanine--tRNA ligase beta subunit n=1 Tax=Guptibacillus hwajinpoensis TaxID=208199 RepID=A0A0J6CWA1_9BACL|nr:phenylalanine--tRNA ligase subunit beta [Alkalihalobacillus macyae]KMM37450.1 phenylalanyl-tRNA synthase subunit beta [Alkalihalobacillus macyae]